MTQSNNRVRRPSRTSGVSVPADSDTQREDETEEEARGRIEKKYRDRATSPLKAIRAFCVLCMGAAPKEVTKCTSKQCVLWPFRHEKNPFHVNYKSKVET